MDDLNNFFAKKDKKKCKSGQFTTANEIDKKLQITNKKREQSLEENDDEWNIYEDRKIDYTGLKIQNFTITEQNYETEVNSVSQTSSPWKGQEAEGEKQNEVWKKPEEKKEVVSIAAWTKLTSPRVSAYVPPHLRNRPALGQKPKGTKAKLNIDDKSMFPMLTSLPSKQKSSKVSGEKVIAPYLEKYYDHSTLIRPGNCISNDLSYHRNK